MCPWRGELQSSFISMQEAWKHDLNSPEWQCSDSTVLHLICAHTHTHTHIYTHSSLDEAIVWSNKASLRDESIVWVEINSHHPAPNEGGLPWALRMTLQGFVREDLTLLLLIMLWKTTTEIRGKRVLLTTGNHVYLNYLKWPHLFILHLHWIRSTETWRRIKGSKVWAFTFKSPWGVNFNFNFNNFICPQWGYSLCRSEEDISIQHRSHKNTNT